MFRELVQPHTSNKYLAGASPGKAVGGGRKRRHASVRKDPAAEPETDGKQPVQWKPSTKTYRPRHFLMYICRVFSCVPRPPHRCRSATPGHHVFWRCVPWCRGASIVSRQVAQRRVPAIEDGRQAAMEVAQVLFYFQHDCRLVKQVERFLFFRTTLMELSCCRVRQDSG